MASSKGCFKNGCFGCLGLLALVLVVMGIIALMGWKDSRNTLPVDTVLTPEGPRTVPDNALFRRGGLVRLNLSEGEFRLKPAAAGEGLRVDAVYDDAMYDLEQGFTVMPDSTWEYQLDFQQTKTGLRAFMRAIFSKGPNTRLTVYLPRDIPIDLDARAAKGGLDVELGGLRVRQASLEANLGGLALGVDEPLAGLEADDLGNASPARLDINCHMGGAEVGLAGAWLNDCRARLELDMGGMEINVPEGMKLVDGWPDEPLSGEQEVDSGVPVLYFEKHTKRGEIEFTR